MRLAAASLMTLAFMSSGIATAAEPRGWEYIRQVEMATAIHHVGGHDPVDCGVTDLDQSPSSEARAAAVACIEDAVKRRAAFKYANVSGEYKTRVETVFVQRQGGEQWLLLHRFDAQANRYGASLRRCRSVTLDPGSLKLDGQDCVKEWPALPEPEGSWPFCCYEGFVESVDAMVGPKAMDCGLIIADKPVADARRLQAVDCVSKGLNGKAPFKFGYLPPKSDVAYIMLRSKAGELWTVRYQRTFSKGHGLETQVNSTCKGIMFDPAVLIYQGYDCTLHSDGGLPTYEPHPDH